MKKDFDLEDNEIRIVGEKPAPSGRIWIWVAVALAIVAVVIFCVSHFVKSDTSEGAGSEDVAAPIAAADNSGCVIIDTIVDNIALRLFVPSGEPMLHVGDLSPEQDTDVVFAAEAAYYRKDNNQISGAFILKGEQLSRGCSMLGYCAIVKGEVYLGMAKSTSLFEEAVEEEGYFFRQKPLVDSCKAIHEQNSRRNPAIRTRRNAIVSLDSRPMVVGCETPLTRNDFADILAQLGCQQAVSLTGGNCFGFARDTAGNIHYWGARLTEIPANINYIVWTR